MLQIKILILTTEPFINDTMEICVVSVTPIMLLCLSPNHCPGAKKCQTRLKIAGIEFFEVSIVLVVLNWFYFVFFKVNLWVNHFGTHFCTSLVFGGRFIGLHSKSVATPGLQRY